MVQRRWDVFEYERGFCGPGLRTRLLGDIALCHPHGAAPGLLKQRAAGDEVDGDDTVTLSRVFAVSNFRENLSQ